MKLPPKNSRCMTIIQALRRSGPVTIAQGVALHGSFNKVTPADMTELYAELVALGCLEHVGSRYQVSEAVHRHYHPKLVAAPGPLVPARTPNAFRPLSARYLVSSRGQREGSNDLREVASCYPALEKTTP